MSQYIALLQYLKLCLKCHSKNKKHVFFPACSQFGFFSFRIMASRVPFRRRVLYEKDQEICGKCQTRKCFLDSSTLSVPQLQLFLYGIQRFYESTKVPDDGLCPVQLVIQPSVQVLLLHEMGEENVVNH